MAVRSQHMARGQVICRVFACLVALACALALCPLGASPAYADAEHALVAGASEMATARTLTLPGMVPVTGDQVKDGVYEIDAESSSSFFKVVSAKLTVEAGEMTAELKMRSKTYPLVYLGTGKQAAAAPAEDYVPFNESEMTFTIPVEALDSEFNCAAFSKNRKKWYDRTMVLYAATLPQDALLVDLPEYGTVEEGTTVAKTASDIASGTRGAAGEPAEAIAVDMPDGEYSIEVNMTGGSGRASVSSPTWLIVEDGRAYARLLWSSSYYDYMIVDEEKYLNRTDDGSNSTFVIPITVMDEEIPVIADTTAMGDPVEIEYQLTFYSMTIGDKDLIPQEAAIKVLYLAVGVIIVGGVLNYFVKKRRRQ